MLALALGACTAFEPAPLDVEAIVAEVAAARAVPPEPGADAPTLATATHWLLATGPAVRDATAAYQTARARADAGTPWPDPTLELGPQWATGDDADPSRRLTPFVALAITIPLSGRLGAQQELEAARAERLRIEATLTLRDEYLGLRAEFAQLALARQRERLADDVVTTATRTIDAARRLVEAGAATALDVALFDLERARVTAARLDAAAATQEAAGALAHRTGVAAERFAATDPTALPTVPAAVPDRATLDGLLATQRHDLVALAAEYAVAECALRLEIERQYPDLVLGPEWSSEPGESKEVFRLGLGVRVPLFDRNQPAIAEATAYRDELRDRYTSAVRVALADVDRRVAALNLATARRAALVDDVLPRATHNLELARSTAAAGSLDVLRLLDAERSLRALDAERLAAQAAELHAWLALERAIGHPLLTFPDEPAAPPELDATPNPHPTTDDEASR